MLSFRRRKYLNFIVDFQQHKEVIAWKKGSRKILLPLPGDLFDQTHGVISEFFEDFDFLTVPAPSFHTYDHYPIWEIAKKIVVEANLEIELKKLFPKHSGKTKMQTFGSCGKFVQKIFCPPGKFVLILDDLYTTGTTLSVSCEAVALRGSFPVGLAIA